MCDAVDLLTQLSPLVSATNLLHIFLRVEIHVQLPPLPSLFPVMLHWIELCVYPHAWLIATPQQPVKACHYE